MIKVHNQLLLASPSITFFIVKTTIRRSKFELNYLSLFKLLNDAPTLTPCGHLCRYRLHNKRSRRQTQGLNIPFSSHLFIYHVRWVSILSINDRYLGLFLQLRINKPHSDRARPLRHLDRALRMATVRAGKYVLGFSVRTKNPSLHASHSLVTVFNVRFRPA